MIGARLEILHDRAKCRFHVQRVQVYFASGYFQFLPPLYVAGAFGKSRSRQ